MVEKEKQILYRQAQSGSRPLSWAQLLLLTSFRLHPPLHTVFYWDQFGVRLHPAEPSPTHDVYLMCVF